MMLHRRAVVAAAVLAPLLTLGGPRAAMGQGRSALRFAPASTPYRLTRTVERQLGRAGKLVVARSWTIRFVPSSSGFQVGGTQSAVTVDAPPVLADLARIERERVEEAMFPLLVGSDGMMATGAAARTDDALAQAVERVRARLAERPLTAADRAKAESFIEGLQAAGHSALAAWPPNLFAPGARSEVASRAVPLPGGATGTLTITTTATSDPATGLMQRFERRIDTVVGTQSKTGAERFELTPEP